MLGTYLRVERKRLLLDSVDVADHLGLNDTYYRLVESGRAALNQSLVFKLLELFAARAAAGMPGHTPVHFQRLAMFLVGTQWVGVEMASLGTKRDSDRRAMETLATLDDDFALFHKRTRRYYELPEGDIRRLYLQDDVAPEVAEFLSTLAYARPIREALVEQVLPSSTVLALPTLNVEMVTRLIADLSGRPFVHTPPLAAAWENRMAPSFKSLRGVYVRKNQIVEKTNLSMFHYPYLFERAFREVRFVFLESGDERTARRDFFKELNAARREAGLEEAERHEMDKMKIAFVSGELLERVEARFEALRSRADSGRVIRIYDAYWSFDTTTGDATSGVPISFVGIQGSTAQDGIRGSTSQDIWNLSLEDALTKRAEFDKLWSEVYVDSE